MYCKKCGKQLPDGATFCGRCGARLAPARTDGYGERRKKTPWALIISAGAVLIAGAAVAIVLLSNPSEKFDALLRSGDIAGAQEVYNEKIAGDYKTEDKTVDSVNAYIDEVLEGFRTGELSYQDACRALDTVADCGVYDETKLLDASDDIYLLNSSRIAFDNGNTYYAASNWADAISAYRQVITEDANYSAATEGIKKAETECRNDAIKKCDEAVAAGKYEDAITALTRALSVLPSDQTLTTKLESISSEKFESEVSATLAEAAGLVAAKDYSQAFSLLESAYYSTGDTRLSDAYAKYTAELEAAALKEAADKFAKNRDYTSAVAALNTALAMLPDSSALLDAKAGYMEYAPVYLKDIEPFNEMYAYNSSSMTDTYGNSYVSVIYFLLGDFASSAGTYIEYNTQGKYNKLVMTIAPFEHYNTNASAAMLEVYADDILVYQSPGIERKTTAFTVEIDIKNAQFVKIVRPRVAKDERIFIADAYFTK